MLPPSDYFFPLSTFTIFFFPFHSRLLVGAPNAESGQPGVERAGAVYKCAAETPGNCELIPFDTKGKKEKEEEEEGKFFLGGRGGVDGVYYRMMLLHMDGYI